MLYNSACLCTLDAIIHHHAGSGEGFDHFGSYIHNVSLHFTQV
jgi:hypothetical protein